MRIRVPPWTLWGTAYPFFWTASFKGAAMGRAEDTMISKKVIFSGQVQGVGFRYRTSRVARNFQVFGYVKNLADGNVEVLCEGAPEEVQAFIQQVTDQMQPHIETFTTADQTPVGYTEFTVEH